MMIAGSEGLLVDMHYGQKQAYSISYSAESFAKLSQAQAPALLAGGYSLKIIIGPSRHDPILTK